jgi:uncharacterized Tic20 family protein
MSENPSPAPEPTPAAASSGDKTERTMAMLCHLLAFSGLIIPLGHILGPLILWLVKKDSMPMVNEHGKESVNFQITLTIVGVVCGITAFLIVPILIAIVVAIAAIVLVIMKAIKANEGQSVRYPYTLRLIK